MLHISANVGHGISTAIRTTHFGHSKSKKLSQLEYILHLFLKITISAYYNYLQVSHFLVKLEPVFLLLLPWQVKPNWAAPTVGPTPASNRHTRHKALGTRHKAQGTWPKTHIFNHWHFLNQTSSRSSYQFDQEDIYSISLCWTGIAVVQQTLVSDGVRLKLENNTLFKEI